METFFQVSESFFELINFFLHIVALGSCMRGGGGICAEQQVFSSIYDCVLFFLKS